MVTLLMTKSISILIFLSLFGLNAYIYLNTKKKIEAYSRSPPFRMEDFTKSNRKNKTSKIKNLRDNDQTTFWIKEQNSSRPDYDLELELTLTHVYAESKFKKKDFHSIIFHSCLTKENYTPLRNPNQLQVDVFLREAINVDKELRFPYDTKIASLELDFKDSKNVQIDISKAFALQDSSSYPENIFILTLFMKDNSIHTKEGKTCLSEIEVD